ncbi:MAG: dihydrolipoyl dehydrogenase [Cytophagales bacterium]|uniref:dihydrolipoyl dehydrogenase n=1 Tax=Cyclobacterium marinum TaxID=104 RepID=UPI0030DDB6D7|nr:dihydrolipoyl dehydrogenase [Cytophagales bacterium]|tara:strand:- start:4112 stop:5494 length:1383 start_codon:yes stop_codon:yes gene_type:complete
MKNYDAVIIGAGQAGMPLAKKISAKGLTVALIEKRVIGGTCINDGCSPTKTMVASARVAHIVSRAEDFGVNVKSFSIDQKVIKARKDHIVTTFRGGAEKSLKKAENIDIILGKATVLSSNKVSIDREGAEVLEISGEKIFLNTGSSPFILEIDGLKETPYLTSSSIMELEETPEHLIILGAGYIGLEFGQMFNRFGSKVTIIDKAPRLVPKEDKDVCEEVSKIFTEESIETILEAAVTKVNYENKQFKVYLEDNTGPKMVEGSHLLVATGRKPNSKGLGLEGIGVKLTEKGHIVVNETFETSLPNIYALGDVAGSPPFTHMAYNDAHIAFRSIYEGGKEISSKDRLLPYCVFIDPQLARIGLNEQEAKEKGISYKVGKFFMKHAGRALETDETSGFFKVLVDPKSKQILGATILSLDGGDVMAVLQMAMVGEVTYDKIQNLPIAHPTLAESLNNLMMQIE